MANAQSLQLSPSLLRFYRIGLVAHSALITAISVSAYSGLLPTKNILFPHYDLVMHFLLVGMFGFFMDGALAHKKLIGAPFFPRLGPTIALLLAATEETLQRFSPRRSSNWSDFIANATGILICSWLALKISESRSQRAEGAA